MRKALVSLAALGLVAACTRAPAVNAAPAANAARADPAPAAASAAPVAGVYVADGKPATLAYVSTLADDAYDGQPITAIILSAKPQTGDAKERDFVGASLADDARQGAFGDAIVVHVEADGTVIGADMSHVGFTKSEGYMTAVGALSIKGYRAAGGQISGEITSGGPYDAGGGQTVNVDLTFHTKAP